MKEVNRVTQPITCSPSKEMMLLHSNAKRLIHTHTVSVYAFLHMCACMSVHKHTRREESPT